MDGEKSTREIAHMAGRTVLITGATSGIGLEAARTLARMGARVVLGVRDPARGSAVSLEISRRGGSAEVLRLDLSSLASTREAAARFSASHDRLDVLINNAGTAVARRELTADGHERTWQTNFLSQFLLTRLLLPVLRRAEKPRIVNVGSDAHRTGRLDWNDLELAKHYGGYRAYANTKLALALFTRELARREPGIAVNVVHPGAVATNIWRPLPAPARWLIAALLRSSESGAAPVVRLAADPAFESTTGLYFSRFKEARLAPPARNDEDAVKLWQVAEKATGLAG
jgi:NAD(P)-dependent dehydrogenase (short-subunit alcohol dehydrogenase family)